MQKRVPGFTIVELLVVIAVIGILAAITIIAYSGIQSKAKYAAIQVSVKDAAKEMELVALDGASYPTAFPSTVKAPAKGTVLSLSEATSGFCINAEIPNDTASKWFFSNTSGGLQQGSCPGNVIVGSELGANPNIILNQDYTAAAGWSLNIQAGASGRVISTRTGVSTDPYPGRAVLIVNNPTGGATSWAVLQSTGINRAAITVGPSKPYNQAYYVRRTGTGYAASLAGFAVQNGSALNASLLAPSAATAITNDWQRLSGTTSSVQAGQPDNGIYLPLGASSFTTGGWTLEFQNFELRQQ